MDKALISVSMVVYKPDMAMLQTALTHLKLAFAKLLCTRPATFILTIVDNSVVGDWERRIASVLTATFADDKAVSYSLVSSGENLGYGGGNNLAIKAARSLYHIVMNPDVSVEGGALLNAVEFMDKHPEVGLLIPVVYGKDGRQHFLCKKNPTVFDMYLRSFSPKFLQTWYRERMQKFEMRDKDYQQMIWDVPYPTGCFMFLRTATLQQINGFDEGFFLHFEDADLGRRLLKVSRSAYVPQVKVTHHWQRSWQTSRKMQWIMIKSGVRYFCKYGVKHNAKEKR